MTSGVPRAIALLPPDVANQIAAGEVVERPASVVKELVENAIDAGATSVSVIVDGGGVSRIAVTDDGEGMNAEDLRLSVVRHATSKIREVADLVGVSTYGFRGEALPSIASVARVRITTRSRASADGVEIVVDGGTAADVRPCGCAPGTTVNVEDLFFNTPARRKFLKTAATEGGACADAMVRLALPRPEIRFALRRDGKLTRELLRRDDVAQRVRDVFSDEPLARMDGTRGDLRVVALLGPPERARSGTQSVALYVNGRHVRDRLLLRAVAQAYASTLDGGRYPVGALFLDVPARDVDVNVHPQKSEVRFAAPNEVFAAISAVIREQLAGSPWARAATSGTSASLSGNRFSGGPAASLDAARALPGVDAATRANSGSLAETPATVDPWGLAPSTAHDDLAPARDAAVASENLLGEGTFGALRYIAQIRRMFLLCEGPRGLVILDQHAAAERVTYQRLRRAFASRAVAMQPMLVVERVEVSAKDVSMCEERRDDLAALGFEIIPMGPSTLGVRAVPALLGRADPRRLVRDLIAELGRHGNDFSRAIDLAIATMACHGSVRAGDDLADDEARALLRALDDVEFAGHCPHGRPVVWSIGWGELERRVGR